MTSATFRLVLLVSMAHALVHVYEQALPSVEQAIAADFQVQPSTTGSLGTVWRVPFGGLALLAGWLADRFGARRLMIVYLLGCAATAVVSWGSPTLPLLFAVMFAMGCFASIYHPAGLAIISRHTTPDVRGAALGWHGIFGSAGIAAAPLLAALLFQLPGVGWRQFYLVLAFPGALLAVMIARRLPATLNSHDASAAGAIARDVAAPAPTHWPAYLLLVSSGVLAGFLYAAFTHFLPRYLDSAGLRPDGVSPASFRTLLRGVALMCGAAGQGIAGKLARPHRLNRLLVAILLANAPLLAWMALAQGPARLVAACLLAFVHFMHQPVYNSLLPRYVPAARLSTGYGFSNLMCFGLGALGPAWSGYVQTSAPSHLGELWAYGSLALIALAASATAAVLWRRFPEVDR